MIQVKINGKEDEIPENFSVKDVLAARNLPEHVVIITLNEEIIRRENWESQKLSPDDEMEIIRIIGGG
jgi:sulfur carrier protein